MLAENFPSRIVFRGDFYSLCSSKAFHIIFTINTHQIMRISPSTDRQRPVVSHRSAEEMLHDDLYGLDHEEAWLLYLNKLSYPIGKEMVSKGTLDSTAIDCRTIMRQALLHNAAAIVILHNHPSGSSKPSQHDIFFTNKLRQACVLMDIKLEDHIIVGEDDFYSFFMEKSYKYI